MGPVYVKLSKETHPKANVAESKRLNHRVTELNNISNDTLASDVKILKPKSTQFLIAEFHFIHDEYVFCK